MKRKVLWLTIALMALATGANAQFRRGGWGVGMNISRTFEWQTITTNDVSVSSTNAIQSWSVSPSFGYFVREGFSVGPNFILSYNKSLGASTFMYGLAPTVNYYFNPGNRLRPYVSGTIGYIGQRTKYDSLIVRNHSLVVGGGGGLAYFLTNNMSVNLGVDYNYLTGSNKTLTASGRRNVHSLSVGAGIHYYF